MYHITTDINWHAIPNLTELISKKLTSMYTMTVIFVYLRIRKFGEEKQVQSLHMKGACT